MKKERRLSELEAGDAGQISKLLITGSMRRRLLDIGMSPGTVVSCIGKSPFGDPSAYLVRGCAVAIRKRDADGIIIGKSD